MFKLPNWSLSHVSGGWIADRYCSVVTLEEGDRETTAWQTKMDPNLCSLVRGCDVCLPVVSASVQSHSLVSISGKFLPDSFSRLLWDRLAGTVRVVVTLMVHVLRFPVLLPFAQDSSKIFSLRHVVAWGPSTKRMFSDIMS